MEGKSNSESGDPKFIPEQKIGDNPASQEPRQDNELAAVSRRTAFTDLSQVDADLALARRLQEQEAAYMMLTMENQVFGRAGRLFSPVYDQEDRNFDNATVENRANNTDTNNPESVSHEHDQFNNNDDQYEDNHYEDGQYEDDQFEDEQYDDENAGGEFPLVEHVDSLEDENYESEDENYESSELVFDPELYPSDEAYARALQEHEEREMAARLFAFAGISDQERHESTRLRDSLVDEDPDEFTYEELIALGDIVGTESRGLSPDTLASLPLITFDSASSQTGSTDSCVICRLDFEKGEALTILPCKHAYHSECIHNWLNIKKVCPFCSIEVTHP